MNTFFLNVLVILISVGLSVVVNIAILRKGAEITAEEIMKVEERIMKKINRQ